MIVTIADLRALDACAEDVQTFSDLFGDSVEVTRETIMLAYASGIDVAWWARRVWGDAYVAATAEAEYAYDAAIDEAKRTCWAATAAARRVYKAATADARSAYWAAEAEAWRVYSAACADVILHLIAGGGS